MPKPQPMPLPSPEPLPLPEPLPAPSPVPMPMPEPVPLPDLSYHFVGSFSRSQGNTPRCGRSLGSMP